jgi:nucleotide-binding universal stress UspA family protein
MKVIVATDGSAAAIDAARRAVGLLRPDAQIVLVTVIPDLEDPLETAGGFEGPLVTEEEARRDFAEAAGAGNAALTRTAAALDEAVELRLVPRDEDPGHAIAAVAEQEHADLVVIGSGGKGFIHRLFTGSVSDVVIHHAPCPVLVVRHDHA